MKQNVSLKKQIATLTAGITRKKLAIILLGTAISSFGMYNIHQQTNITEGGVLGMILLLNHWFGISPSLLTPILDFSCYLLALKFLGGGFFFSLLLSTLSFSAWFRLSSSWLRAAASCF